MSQRDREVVWQGSHLEVVVEGRWQYVRRRNVTGIVCIVPITESGELILIEQQRIPVGRRVIELPAGLVGDEEGFENESLEEAATRELVEETGFIPASLERLFDGVVSAGLSDEALTFYLARGCRRIAPGGGDASEDIQVHVVRPDEVLDWIEAQRRERDVTVDVKAMALLYFWLGKVSLDESP